MGLLAVRRSILIAVQFVLLTQEKNLMGFLEYQVMVSFYLPIHFKTLNPKNKTYYTFYRIQKTPDLGDFMVTLI